jgi:hypothetical protein
MTSIRNLISLDGWPELGILQTSGFCMDEGKLNQKKTNLKGGGKKKERKEYFCFVSSMWLGTFKKVA